MSDRAPEQNGGFSIPLVGGLASAPRNIAGALSDLRSIAENMLYLPELLKTLGAIEERVESLDDEVAQMRKSVDDLNVGVEEMSAHVEVLGPHLEEMRVSLRPLKRAAGRVGRLGRRERPAAEPEPAE